MSLQVFLKVITFLFNLFINYIIYSINYSNILLFSDDVKIFNDINSLSDTDDFQKDLTSFINWCIHDDLFSNINKCHIINFSKEHNYLIFNHNLNIILTRTNVLKDLGILFDTKL